MDRVMMRAETRTNTREKYDSGKCLSARSNTEFTAAKPVWLMQIAGNLPALLRWKFFHQPAILIVEVINTRSVSQANRYTTSSAEPSKSAAAADSTSCPRLRSHRSVSAPMFSSNRIFMERRSEPVFETPTVPPHTPRRRSPLGHPPPSIADTVGGFQGASPLRPDNRESSARECGSREST